MSDICVCGREASNHDQDNGLPCDKVRVGWRKTLHRVLWGETYYPRER